MHWHTSKDWWSPKGARWQPMALFFNVVGSWLRYFEVDAPLTMDITEKSCRLGHNFPLDLDDSDMTQIGDATEGSEAADTTDVEYETNSQKGVRMHAMTRVAYFDTGNQVLYGYVRELRFDPRGHLIAISAETRVVIDVPGACP